MGIFNYKKKQLIWLKIKKILVSSIKYKFEITKSQVFSGQSLNPVKYQARFFKGAIFYVTRHREKPCCL